MNVFDRVPALTFLTTPYLFTWNLVIFAPPFELGAFQVTRTLWLPLVERKLRGFDGFTSFLTVNADQEPVQLIG